MSPRPPPEPQPEPQIEPVTEPVVRLNNERWIAFETADDSTGWVLQRSNGHEICALPCSAPIAANDGYMVRSLTGESTTFMGFAAASATRAVLQPRRGATALATITMVGGGAFGVWGLACAMSSDPCQATFGGKQTDGAPILLGIGAVTLVGGLVWFIYSRDHAALDWEGDSGHAELKHGLRLSMNWSDLSVVGRW